MAQLQQRNHVLSRRWRGRKPVVLHGLRVATLQRGRQAFLLVVLTLFVESDALLTGGIRTFQRHDSLLHDVRGCKAFQVRASCPLVNAVL